MPQVQSILAIFACVHALHVRASSRMFMGETYKDTTLDSSLVEKTLPADSLLRCFHYCAGESNCNFISYEKESGECSLVEDGPLSDLPSSKIITTPRQNSISARLLPYFRGGIPEDCENVNSTDSLHLIEPRGLSQPIVVECKDGWTVIQKRFNGSVDFNRTWDEYKNGFGNFNGEFWIGNEIIHQITKEGDYKMVLDMGFWNGAANENLSPKFQVGNESTNYLLNMEDSFGFTKQLTFTTADADNDNLAGGNCATRNQGAYWYDQCSVTNPNARYPPEGGTTCDNAFDMGNKEYCLKLSTYVLLKSASMRIKKVS